jgi:hypothetical protein
MDENISDYKNTYVDIIIEYIDAMKKSNFILSNQNKDFLLHIGFRALTHIFQINYLYTNDLEMSFYSSQKAYIFYLEYLEQMEKTNMSHDLNYTDAIQFLYNKTISHITPNANFELSDEYAKVSRLTELIIWSNNSDIYKSNIQKKTILNCFNLDYDAIKYCLEVAKLRKMNENEYTSFLSEIYVLLKKYKKNDDDDFELRKVYKFADFNVNINLPIKQWCKWLIVRP